MNAPSTPSPGPQVGPHDRGLRSVPTGHRFTPSTRVLWRAPDRLQLELGRRSVVVDGLDADTVSALSRGEVRADAENADLLDTLRRAGFVTRATDAGPDHDPPSVTAGLLAPDLGALAARFGERAGAVLRARADRRVAVHGGGRLPTLIASLLAAAGVGHVNVADLGEVSLHDAAPGGFSAADEGARVAAAASAAIHRVAPGADTSPVSRQITDLVVLTMGAPVPRPLAAGFEHAGQPHLVTGVWAASAVIGPLVLPGRSSCLQCAELQRRDRDPAWPALAAQLVAGRQRCEPSDVVVSALAAAMTSVQALQYLDGEDPAAVDGTIEFSLPDWRWRRRSWPIHPHCRCAVPMAG